MDYTTGLAGCDVSGGTENYATVWIHPDWTGDDLLNLPAEIEEGVEFGAFNVVLRGDDPPLIFHDGDVVDFAIVDGRMLALYATFSD